MNQQEYIDLVKYTVFNTYPDYYVDQLLEILSDNKKINLEKKLANKIKEDKNSRIFDVSHIIKSKDKLNKFLKYDKTFDFCKFIEKYELKKSYRHSVMFSFENLDNNILKRVVKNGSVILFQENSEQYDFVDEFFRKPTMIEEENKITFKFSLMKSGFINEDSTISIKYPVLIVVDLKNNLLEIRFDQIKSMFQTNKEFYKNIIKQAEAWIISMLCIKLNQIEFKSKIKKIVEVYNSDMDKAEVIPMKRDVFLNSGSKVVLDIDSNKEFVVPIIGELKFIMESFKEELGKFPNMLLQLQNLIKRVEEGEVPKVSLLWKNKDIMVGITHDYKDNNYSLFHYYGEIKEAETMDYVREYINKY